MALDVRPGLGPLRARLRHLTGLASGGVLARLLRDQQGAIGVIAVFGLTVMMSFIALVTDYGYLTVVRNHLQVTADASALAGISRLGDDNAVRAEATAFAGMNMAVAVHGNVLANADVLIGNWNGATRVFTTGGTPENAVRVFTRRAQANTNPVPALLSAIMGFTDFDINTAAVAYTGGFPESCIVALNPTDPRTFWVEGDADIRAIGCNITINSCHATQAFKAQGQAALTVTNDQGGDGTIDVCGGALAEGPVQLNPLPTEYTGYQEPDPFASVQGPDPTTYDDPSDCDFTNFASANDVTLTPGVYCGGMTINGSGTATFQDGLYIIKDGAMNIEGDITALTEAGGGNTFFLTGSSACVDFAGDSGIGLKAQTTGPLGGFLFMGDRDNPCTTQHELRGSDDSGYNGIMYFPEAHVEMHGEAAGQLGTTSDCAILIADSFRFRGSPGFNADNTCSSFYGTDVLTANMIFRLVD